MYMLFSHFHSKVNTVISKNIITVSFMRVCFVQKLYFLYMYVVFCISKHSKVEFSSTIVKPV